MTAAEELKTGLGRLARTLAHAHEAVETIACRVMSRPGWQTGADLDGVAELLTTSASTTKKAAQAAVGLPDEREDEE
jgi:hypothetical protein